VFSLFPVSSIVRLSTGETGQVVAVNEGKPLAPQVQILLTSEGKPKQENKLIDLSREREIHIVKEVNDRELMNQTSWNQS
jgi:hypothetical protein